MTSSGTEDHTTPGDDPEAYVAEDRRWALAGGRSIDGRVTGTTLFADVSGFTALTEALAGELGPQRGAEELTGALERVFGALIGCLHEVGGAVVYFSGDAITAWIDGDTGRRAVSAAFAMQDAMDRVGRVTSPAGATVDLGVKVAVAGGNARRFVVGDPAIQLIDVLAGSLMDEVADAEGAAFPGEVVVTERVLVALGEDAVDVEKREGTLGRLACVGELARREPPTSGYADSDPLPEDTVRRWLLPAVYERMRAGRGEFLAELRPAVPVFVKFEGIDFDGDDDAPELLDAFMVSAQRVIDSYGGTLLQLTVGDKGAYIYAVFGTPEAHEDDAARACAAALELLTLQNDTITGMQVGVASGRLRSGTYGHRRRRTFCCLGDAVNLAARLMSKAPVGGVLVADEVRRAAGSGFHVGPVELLHLKGKARATAAARLLGISSEADAVASVGLPLVGRDAALDVVVAHLEQVDAGRGLLLGLVGASGIGKTRLLEEASARAVDRGLVVVRGTARSYGAIAPYSAWWGIGRQLLGVRDEMDVPTLLDHLHQLLPAELAARAPLLGSVLGMPLPDNELTATLDAKLRKASVEDLVDRLLRQRVRTPTALVLDDAHLLEPLGRDLLVVAARAATVLPLALLLGYQPADGALLGLDLPGLTHELVLDPLPVEDARSLAVAELTALGFPEAVHAEAVDLAVGRADGNPLWVRELCRYVVERAGDDDDAPLDALDLPGTLHGLVLSRLDRLDETPRRTAKVASVAGVVFTAGLVRQSYPDLGEAGDVRRSLQELDRRDVAQTEDVADDRWAFTHALLRDVAYESLPFALRTTLHGRMGEAIEAGALGDPARRLDDLAHHFWHSDDDDKKRTYLMAAGVAAQTAYANDAALGSFRRLLTLLASEEQGDVLVRIGKILELQGDWPAAHDAFSEALRLAEEHLEPRAAAWARTWLAEVARKQG
ncbi:MAG: AAA family ATPase, partial [Nocardioides sp.]